MMRKELRLLWPGALLAMGGPGVLALLSPFQELAELIPIVFSFGCLYLGVAGFGAEFDHGTLAGYLALPRTRWQLYRAKMLALGALLLMATAWLGFLRGGFQLDPWLVWVPPLAFCTGPLLAMLARGTFAGLAFCAGLPMALVLACWTAWQAALRLSGAGSETPEWSASLDAGFRAATPFYLLIGLLAGWGRFRTLDAADSPGVGSGRAGETIGYPGAAQLDALLRRWLPDSAWSFLLRKELRLQSVPWLLAGMTTGIWVLWAMVRSFSVDPTASAPTTYSKEIVVACLPLGFLTVLMAGASVVSEERQCGTLSWQLTQPCNVRQQWGIKLGVAVILALLLGVALPIALLILAPGWDVLAREIFSSADRYAEFTWGVAGILAVAIYGSSLSRTSAKAAVVGLLIALGMLATAVATVAGLATGVTSLLEPVLQDPSTPIPSWTAPGWALDGVMISRVILGGYWFAFTTLVLTLATLSFRNFRQDPPGSRRGGIQLAGLALFVVWITALATLPFLWLHASTRVHFNADRAAAERLENGRAARMSPAPQAQGEPRHFTMHPSLMRRYGLVPGGPATNLIMRRYGLVPVIPAPSAAKPPPEQSDAKSGSDGKTTEETPRSVVP